MELKRSAAGGKHYPWGTWLMLLLIAGFIIMALMQPGDTLAFDSEQIYDFSDGWQLLDDSGQIDSETVLTIPTKIETDGIVRIAKTISDERVYPAVISLRTSQQKVRLYCDNKLLYSFGYDNPPIFGKSPGSCWNFIRLPKEVVGKTLVLELQSPYAAYHGRIESIQIGSKAALLFGLLRKYAFSILVTLIIFGVGVITLLIYFFIIRKNTTVGKEILYLGLFAVFISIWLFGEGRLTQFFGIPPAINTYITFLAMLATPIPIVRYVAIGRKDFKQRILYMVSKFLSLLLVFSLLLQGFGVADFIEQLPFLHTCFGISAIIILYTVVTDAIRYRNAEQYRLMISLGILALFFGMEMVFLYIDGQATGNMMRIGVLAIIAIQMQAGLKNASSIMQMSRLAGVDALTGCLNRTIYNQTITELEGYKSVGVVIADMNNLKIINDTYGHDIGDDAIIHFAKNFSEAFSSYGMCFRIGGDEFAMLGKNISMDQLCRLGISFQELNKTVDTQEEYPFTVSYGYAVYDPQHDQSLSDTICRADKFMYHNKKQFKERWSKAKLC